jgi:hypothetical protein
MPDTCESTDTIIIADTIIADQNPERIIPDGLSNPMTSEDLKLIRRMRPDLDEMIQYATTADIPDDD